MSWAMTTDEIAEATGAVVRGPLRTVQGVGTDSRSDLAKKLFVALKGDRFDAHDFLNKAIDQGATAVLVHEDRPEFQDLSKRATILLVPDTLVALQQLATFWRRKNAYLVVAITGSNGKTSSKEFAYQLVRNFRPTFASAGSLNNHWGVPISILSAQPSDQVLLLEMGMNHLGEIDLLAKIAEPNIAVVTMVGTSHIGEVGSQESIAKAKEELYLAAPNALAIFNLDNNWTNRMYERTITDGRTRVLTFGSHNSRCNVALRAERMTVKGLEVVGHIGSVVGQCKVKVFGRQNIVNLMVAASIGLALGMAPELIWQNLSGISSSAWGRNQWLELRNGASVLFDAYNANPDSMTAMLKNIYEIEVNGRLILILGEMLELGSVSESAHFELGELVGKVNPSVVWFIGEHHADFARGLNQTNYRGFEYLSPTFDQKISQTIKDTLSGQDVIAVKASRGIKLETVLEHWGLKV
jgi:UDP-N-acetylmuramoyl-tripeptide--D-alanyl-D-alanine ligase